MPKIKLTHPHISTAKTPTGSDRIEYHDTVVEGLTVRITAAGTKSFVLRYGSTGKRFTIGRFPEIGIAEARSLAKDHKRDIGNGIDPLAEKYKARNASTELTFSDLADLFKKRHLPTLAKKTAFDYAWIIDRELCPILGKREAAEITRRDIKKLLDDIVEERGLLTLANRVRAVLSSIYSYGIDKFILEDNPVRNVKKVKGEKKRARIMTNDELRDFWNACQKQADPIRSLFMMLLIMGQRSGETRKMKWADVDLRQKIWIIPEADTKAKREHQLPLSDLAVKVLTDLRKLTGHTDWVFASPYVPDQPIGWIHKALQRIRIDASIPDIRIHDLRRTAASFMAKLGTERTVLGKVLNHKGLSGDDSVTAIYDHHKYGKEMRRALQAWADELQELVTGERRTAKIYNL